MHVELKRYPELQAVQFKDEWLQVEQFPEQALHKITPDWLRT